jgi:NTP pyrophosphatase (non-canonical NTP hydrolase)
MTHFPDLKDIAESHWKWVEQMGWHNKTRLESLALIASELADIILRVVDLAETEGININRSVLSKLEKNLQIKQKPEGKVK